MSTPRLEQQCIFRQVRPHHCIQSSHSFITKAKMGGGLAFLTKKSFNPANWSNQRQVWEARQTHASEQRRLAEREAQLKREREEEDMARLVGGEEEGGRKALGFMYEGGRIPGLKREKVEEETPRQNEFAAKSDSLYERQPGDDDAAAAFRAMLARGTVEETNTPAGADMVVEATATADVNQEEKGEHVDNRTNLEKAVGRGINSGSGVTLTQQIERFPMLKNAPMVLKKPKEGEAEQTTDVVGLNFKPLGQVLRNVKCLSCGEWGHSKGDRECKVSGWDPFRMSATAPSVASKAVPATEQQLHAAPEVPKQSDEKRKSQKKSKRRHKEDRHKRKRKHKQRRRSPSYSSDSSATSHDSRDEHRKRGRTHSDDDSIDERGRRKESRHRTSSRKYKRRRERSRSPSYQSDNSRRRYRDEER